MIKEQENSRQWYLQLCSREDIPSLTASTLIELCKVVFKLKRVSALTLVYEILAERIRKDLDIDLVVDSCNLGQIHYEQLSETSRGKIKIICLSHNIPYKKEVFAEKNKVRYLHEIWSTDIGATEWYLISKASERHVDNYMIASGLEKEITYTTLTDTYCRNRLITDQDIQLISETVAKRRNNIIVFDNPVKNEQELLRAFYSDSDAADTVRNIIRPSYLIEFWKDLLSIKENHYIWKPKRNFLPGTVLDEEYEILSSYLHNSPNVTVIDPSLAPADLAHILKESPIIAFPLSSAIMPESPIYKNRSLYYCPESMYQTDLNLDTMNEVELIVGKTALERRLSNHFLSKN